MKAANYSTEEANNKTCQKRVRQVLFRLQNKKKALKEKIFTMAVLNQAEKRRYGNLYISLKISYFRGKNNHPDTIPDVLRVLYNYKPEWTQITTKPPNLPEKSGMGVRNSSVLFFTIVREQS